MTSKLRTDAPVTAKAVAEDIVARDGKTYPQYRRLEWDNAKAGEKWRLCQAQQLLDQCKVDAAEIARNTAKSKSNSADD